MMINTEGIVIRMMCSDISVLGRVTSGVKLMNLSENVSVASIAKVRETSADSEDIIKKIEDEMIEDEKNDEEIKNEATVIKLEEDHDFAKNACNLDFKSNMCSM